MTTLVLSDVHANAAALDGVLAAEPDLDQVLFLGDAVDVGPRPDTVCSMLRAIADHRVSGNHDRLVLEADPSVESGDEHEQWRQWSNAELSDDNAAFLRTAPRTTVATVGETRVRLHHGDFDAPDDGAEWTTRTTPDQRPDVFETVANRYEEETILLGHSHRPFVSMVNGTTFVNPGSVGLQRDDMRPDVARYARFDGGEFELRSTEYDVVRVVAAYDDLPLPEEFLESWRARYRPGTAGE